MTRLDSVTDIDSQETKLDEMDNYDERGFTLPETADLDKVLAEMATDPPINSDGTTGCSGIDKLVETLVIMGNNSVDDLKFIPSSLQTPPRKKKKESSGKTVAVASKKQRIKSTFVESVNRQTGEKGMLSKSPISLTQDTLTTKVSIEQPPMSSTGTKNPTQNTPTSKVALKQPPTASHTQKRVRKRKQLPLRATKAKKMLGESMVINTKAVNSGVDEYISDEQEFDIQKANEEDFQNTLKTTGEDSMNESEVSGDEDNDGEDLRTRDPSVHILDAITDWSMGRIRSRDSKINGGDGTQYLEDAFSDYVDKAFVDAEESNIKTQIEDFKAIEDKIKQWEEEKSNLTNREEKITLWQGIKNEKIFLKKAKGIFEENIKAYKARFLKSTITTLMGLSYEQNKDPNHDPPFQWYGKFQYKDKRDKNLIITEIIPLDEAWLEANLVGGFHDEVKRISMQCDEPDRWVDLPNPKVVAIDKRNIIKCRFWPSRTVNGKRKFTTDDARALEKTDPEAFWDRYPDGIYRNIFERKSIPSYFEVWYHDNSKEQFNREQLIERCGEGYVIMLEELQKKVIKGGSTGNSNNDRGGKNNGSPGGGGSTPKPTKLRFAPVPSRKSKARHWGRPPDMSPFPTKCKYNQCDYDACVFTSFASALHYGGLDEAAEQTYKLGISDYYLEKGDPPKRLQHHVINGLKLKFNIRKLKGYQKDLEYLQKCSINVDLIFVCILNSTDGCRDHAVSILNGLIFDGNEEYAMPLTRGNMDFCCSDSTGMSKFDRILMAHSYESKYLRLLR